jgi:RNA polymerase sigma factor (sigma-70 family)
MTETQQNISAGLKVEDDLVQAAKADIRCFEGLYLHYVKQVYRYLFSRIGSQPDAEDVTAQTFLGALEGFERYQHDGHFAAWLFAIARRKAADYFRLAGRSRFLPDDMPSLDPDLLSRAIQVERQHDLRATIQAMDEEEQELLRLRFAARLTFAEIARLTNRKEDAVKKSVYRLLDRLQNQLEESHE